jgi:hypothetical protein
VSNARPVRTFKIDVVGVRQSRLVRGVGESRGGERGKEEEMHFGKEVGGQVSMPAVVLVDGDSELRDIKKY